MKNFMDKDFLLTTETAKKLYHEHAEGMPIIDYHCHLQPKEIGVVYEATAIKNNKEQKIEISATDGKVISFEEEVND